jgi:hypothetical protein
MIQHRGGIMAKAKAAKEKPDRCAPAVPPGCEIAGANVDQELGEFICEKTPYSGMFMPADWQCEVEWDAGELQWSFRGVTRRVGKAMRIPVIVAFYNENTCQHEYYKDWLLVGYEGAGGY